MAPRRARAAAAAPAAATEGVEEQKPSAVASERPAKRAKAQDGGAAAAAAHAAAEPSPSGGPSYWLMKSEPDVFSIDDLAAKPDQTEHWDGVRSHQAKKVLQAMRLGDKALFYHSNAKPPGVVGIVEIAREAYPDHTQFDPASEYYDARASRDSPTWVMVDCRLVRKLDRQISLEELKSHAGAGGPLASMALFKYGRLSVQPVTAAEWEFVLGLEGQPAPAAAAKGKAAAAKGKAAAEDADGAEQGGDEAAAEGRVAAKGRGRKAGGGGTKSSSKGSEKGGS
ncbi:hypothetical protein ABPG75_005844 [Micractinium tetrahymenae]